MLIVTALGGNALLRRGQPMTAQNQRENVRTAAQALAPVAAEHDLVVGHGNGPQVGLLALQGAAFTDVDGAESKSQIAQRVNAEAVGNLGRIARADGKWVLHFSTDFVFDGRLDRPYAEQATRHLEAFCKLANLGASERIASKVPGKMEMTTKSAPKSASSKVSGTVYSQRETVWGWSLMRSPMARFRKAAIRSMSYKAISPPKSAAKARSYMNTRAQAFEPPPK